jgi:hypothetical protein
VVPIVQKHFAIGIDESTRLVKKARHAAAAPISTALHLDLDLHPFIVLSDDLCAGWIDQVHSRTCWARQRYELIFADLLSDKTLHLEAQSWAAIDERWHWAI